jgi:hypothetical protein
LLAANVSVSVLCNSTVLTNGGNNTLLCNAYAAWNSTTNAAVGGAGGQSSGNVDPMYAQYFNGVISFPYINSYVVYQNLLVSTGVTPPVYATVNMTGLPVINTPGLFWGGQAVNVSLGPQTPANQNNQNVVWGVHSTPYTFGQTAATAATTAGLRISWYMGDNTLNASLPSGATPPAGQTSAAGFAPPGVTFAASVLAQTTPSSGSGTTNQTFTFSVGANMTCLQYWCAHLASLVCAFSSFHRLTSRLAHHCSRRNYSQAVNYTYLSPYVCHAVLTGLPAGGYVNYWITANVTNGSTTTTYVTSSTQMNSNGAVGYFTSNLMPAPSAVGVPSNVTYPFQWALMADVGQTYNSSLTAQYIQVCVGQHGKCYGRHRHDPQRCRPDVCRQLRPDAELPAQQSVQHLHQRLRLLAAGRHQPAAVGLVDNHVAGRAGQLCRRPRRRQPRD